MSVEFTPRTLEIFGRTYRLEWDEDAWVPDRERWPAAWRRLFNTEPPPGGYSGEILPLADEHADLGDTDVFRFGDRLIVSSFDGYSLWVPA